ncbi:MAG: DUF4097 family beta strand repeat protein [Candidatus Eisenbacteria bacterium]|uniref:DUF4097 family beta strand repeat protein n=1 Tax=Eiseniibacteriota bacterium TaxID=2212470 RepID=A0A9D6L7J9_UNCEI|nr:DUF4097 family beta strand repeat protein [Candidatus Eisenbacteria bacterium]MBI3539055.1 DUF4097 family beta strand repeat protein [Candidatus Eisenbacteria bacterium]
MRKLAALLLFVGTIAVTPAWATDPDLWERTLPITHRATVRVVTDDGRIKVGIWDQKQVGLRVTTRGGWRIGGEGGVRVAESHEADRVTLEVRLPHFHFFDFAFHDRSVLIEAWVPRGVDLDITTGDGAVSVPAVEGSVAVRSGDGDVVIDGAKGTFDLKSGDGRVTCSDVDGRLTAHSGDGPVHVSGRFDALELTTGDGTVTADILPGSHVNDRWSVSTGDGGVALTIPGDLKADLAAHTGDGEIRVDVPLVLQGRLTHHDVHGTLDGGGPTFAIRTGDGSIHLRAR